MNTEHDTKHDTKKNAGRTDQDGLDRLLDGAVEAVCHEPLSDAEVAAATARVWGQLQATQAGAFEAQPTSQEHGPELRDCADYKALMPALVAGTLADGRRLLVEDHTRSCLPCRRALSAVREGRPVDPIEAGASTTAAPEPSWKRPALIAATLLLGATAGWFAVSNLWPSNQSELFQVSTIEGNLFRLDSNGLVPVKLGDWIDGGTEIRTSKDGGAEIRLADGSVVEIAERSALEVVGRRRGDLIRVARGSIIVEASDQRAGTLDVATDEFLVKVKGTIFAVTHGSKGSRVSVIEGEVEVEHGRQRHSLFPGQQLGTRATLRAAPFSEEISWSHDVDRYLSILEEFGTLRADLNQVMEADPRYQSQLLDRVPADTFVYIALPNPTAKLAEVYQLIRERVSSSAALSTWWLELEGSGHLDQIDRFVNDVQELSSYLGEETVVALGGVPDDDIGFPVVLSEVTDASGLRSALQAKLNDLALESHDLPIVILDSTTTSITGADEQLLVWIGEDLLVAADDIVEIHRIVNGLDGGFSGTPFHQRVSAAYAEGAEYLGAVDLATVFAAVQEDAEVDGEDLVALEFSGITDVQYLVVERHQDGDRAHTAVDLSFAGERSGIAAWLAGPGPMGGLEFFSQDASFVAGAVTQDPASIFEQMLAIATAQGEDVEAGLAEVEAEIGFDLRSDLIATLGGETVVGIDGPVLPKPSWKIVVEVYDSGRLQSTLETVVNRLNVEQDQAELTIGSTVVDGLTFYVLSAEGAEESLFDSAEVHYTYIDGYLIAAPSQILVERAIQYRDSGSSILMSDAFRDLLPTDGYVDFSGVVFNRLGEAVSDIAGKLPMPTELTDDQQQRVDSLMANITEKLGPSLYCLYGDADRIRLVSNSASLLPLSGLESVFGIGTILGGLDLGGLDLGGLNLGGMSREISEDAPWL